MNLLNEFQSRAVQFALMLLARLEGGDAVGAAELQTMAEDTCLDHYGRVVDPLVKSGILKKENRTWRLAEDFRAFRFPMGTVERDYLAWLLTLPEAELFLSEATREVLAEAGGDASFFDPVQRFVPEGEPLPRDPGPVGFRTLMDAIQGGRMIRYRYRTREERDYRACEMVPWKLEYSTYDRRWWVILYDKESKRTIKAQLGRLKDIELTGRAEVSREEIEEAMEQLLAPEPVVLRMDDVHNVTERCFLVLENQLFEETVLEPDGSCRLKFRYYRFDEDEILRKLLYLGPDVKLVGPESMKQKLGELIDRALEA